VPSNTKSILTDVNGKPIPQIFNPASDQFETHQGTNGAAHVKITDSVAYDLADDMLKVKSLQKKWRSDFAGSSLNTNKWEVVQQGAGHTITVSGGELKINTGTTPNTETILLSKEVFTDPVRALFGCMLSQRIANQEFYIELVSVDPSTLQPDGLHKAGWRLKYEDYTSGANYAVYEVQNNGQSILASGASYIANNVTSYQIFEVELFSDECWFHTRAMDSASGRSASFVRHQQIPDPNALYKVRIRAKNLGTAPSSATDFKFQFVTVVDYAELTAEITAGRGNVASGQALPVQVLNTPTVIGRMDANNVIYTDTTTNLSAGATYTGTTRDAGSSYQAYSRFRVTVMHTAGLTPGHLVIEQSTDNSTWRETHRVPIPSDGLYRTFDFPWNHRYIRVKFVNGSTAQSAFFLGTMLVRSDGGTDFDKTISFVHSTTPLGSGATFTGASLNLGGNHSFNRHRGMVYADQSGTLYLEQSRDGTNWRVTAQASVTAGQVAEIEDLIISQYQRVRYVNGATAQGTFELQSALVRQ
jgi:hypothetical protein